MASNWSVCRQIKSCLAWNRHLLHEYYNKESVVHIMIQLWIFLMRKRSDCLQVTNSWFRQMKHGLDTLGIFGNSVVRSVHPESARGEIVTPYSLLPSKQQTASEIISTGKGRQSENKTNTERTCILQSPRLYQHSRRKGNTARTYSLFSGGDRGNSG